MLTLNTIYDDVVAAATGTSVQQVAGIVKRSLCKTVCSNQTIQPSFSVTYSLGDVTTNGTTTFVQLLVTGTISYVPKGCSACNTRTQSFAEQTMLIFTNASATSAPSVSISQGLSQGALADVDCTTAHAYEIATNVTVSAVYA